MPQHLIAIFGGAVSGAEAAWQLAQANISSVVFDQNALPYGKIEDGLPKWHAKLRDKEEEAINEKLSHPLVHFVPKIRLGKDVHFEDIHQHWGFTAILLATGAWNDRPLAIENIADFKGKGLYYQNDFMYWFNHYHEPEYSGPQMECSDGALVVGGGLASVDVCKALMILNVEKALKEKGIEEDIFSLERSIAKVLEKHHTSLEDLGVKPCTLVYRRRIKDMPLYPGPTDTPEELEKAEGIREKIIQLAMDKYLFEILPNHVAIDKLTRDGRLDGLILRETKSVNGKLEEIPGTDKKFHAPLVVSSIGSIPEEIPGIPWKGSVFEVNECECCRIKGYENVFALGNAVTGRGNIKESMAHGRTITQTLSEQYLFDPEENLAGQLRDKEATVEGNISNLLQQFHPLNPPKETSRIATLKKVEALQKMVGYDGDFKKWIERNKPTRLEEILGKYH
ncbi:MAG: FAD-dependent oxidoreductase [Saprospiraceae bacterium]